jgi:hypothetical protein
MSTPSNLSKRTVAFLRGLAAKLRIPGRSAMRKSALVEAIKRRQTETGDEPAVTAPAPATPIAVPPAVAELGSSPIAQAPAPSSAAHAHQAEPGLPIPEHYGHDRLVLMPQDPQHLFAYWELSGPALAQARAQAGAEALPVLIIHGPDGSEQRVVDLAGGNYYLTVSGNQSYRAELALRRSDGSLVSIAASATINTSSAAPSQRVDGEWMVVDETFRELIAEAGLPGAAGSSLSLSEQRLRAQLWNEQTPAPLGSSTMPSSTTVSGSNHLAR